MLQGELSELSSINKEMLLGQSQSGDAMPEWLDMKALTQYACVSERTLREWIHRPDNPLPAARVGSKLLVRRGMFDVWLENHRLKSRDLGCIVEEIVAGVRARN